MEKLEAVEAISQKIQLLESDKQLNPDLLAFYIEKLVTDILDYCRRDDFPEALVYTVVDLVRKRLADEAGSEEETAAIGSSGPLSAVKMDDTEFHFAVNNVNAAACLSDLSFDSVKAKLNLYRKVASWQ